MRHQNEKSTAQSVEAGAIDPICGMTVSPKSAAGSFEYNGHTYYFCSKHCLAKFQSDPGSFINKSAVSVTPQPVAIQRSRVAASAENTEAHTCPMHPEVRQSGPGSCPKCG